MRALFGALSATFLMLFTSRSAVADTTPSPYSGTVLVVDAAALGMHAAGASLHSSDRRIGMALGGTGIVGWMVGAPVVHIANGRPGVGTLDLALRVALPAAVMLAYAKEDDLAVVAPALYGSIAGVSAFDALVLARPTRDRPEVERRPWREGDEIPPGATLEIRPRRTMLIAGATVASLSYLLWAVGTPCDATRDPCGPLRIPVIGPFLAAGRLLDSGFSKFRCGPEAIVCLAPIGGGMLLGYEVIQGIAQAGGLLMTAISVLSPERNIVRRRTDVSLRPVVGPTAIGLSGTF